MLGKGGFFGEMSLLTGEPRSATVSAIEDASVLEITVDVFRKALLAAPALADQIGLAVTLRMEQLTAVKSAALADVAVQDAPKRLIDRMKRFLRLTTN